MRGADQTPIDAKTLPLCTDTELNLGDRVWGEVDKKSCIALPNKGGHSGLVSSKLCPALEGLVRGFLAVVQGAGRAWSAHRHPSDWLVVGQLGVSIISLLVPSSLGSMCLWAACS